VAGKPVVVVEGARELRATLRKAGDDLGDLRDVHATVSRYVALCSAAIAPRRSGRLAGNVRGSSLKTSAVVRAGGAAVPYAGPIHWGWPARSIVAQPFMVDAAHITEPTWSRWYLAKVEQIVERIHGA
jgi:hypothetical protein